MNPKPSPMLGTIPTKLSCNMARRDQERICQHEQATGMVQDKEKSYASQLKVFKKQVGPQDQAQWCVPGVPSCLWVQSSTGDHPF